jgi:oxygen-independent coproporphyrinogen-3 oxidase
LELLGREIREHAPAGRPRGDTIFLGGGTPSLVPAPAIEGLLSDLRQHFDLAAQAEVTLEMNPDDADPERCAAYREAGVTRVSLGVQSLRDCDLKALDRRHSAAQAAAAVRTLRRAGFDNISLDLIGGLPRQSAAAWREVLQRACALGPEHISMYLLEVDEGQRQQHPIFQRLPAAELVAHRYRVAVEVLEQAGLLQYEISNFARPGREARHNLKYWTDQPYAAFGPAAHGYDLSQRWWNHADLGAYRRALQAGEPPQAGREAISRQRRAEDALILGLRLSRGVDLNAFAQLYGWDVARERRRELERLDTAELIAWDGAALRLTLQGRLLSNEVFVELLPAATSP